MSSRELKLQVVLSALDKITGPLKQITKGNSALSEALQNNKAHLKALDKQQSDIRGYRIASVEAIKQARAIRDLDVKSRGYSQALEEQRAKHVNLGANLKAAQTQYNRLTKAMFDGKGGTAEFQRELQKAQVTLLANRQAFDRSAASIKTYQERIRHADDRMQQLNRQQKTTQERLAGLKTRLETAGIGTEGLRGKAQNLRIEQERMNKTLAEQKAALEKVNAVQKRSAALSEQHGKAMRKVAMMGGLGAGGIAVGQRVYSQASRMLTPGVAFGEQMSELQAISRLDKDDERFVKLSQQARDLGASTAFTAADAAAGQTFLARAGFSPEAIHASMQDMLNLALANKMDLARTADIASNISSAFKIDPEVEGNMQRVGDVLSGVAARSNVNLEMLGETMKYLGGAEDLNISLEQAATMAGLMGNIGIQASQAGTSMRAMMNRLTAPKKSGIGAMEAIGLSVKDAKGQMRDMPDILMDIAKATQNMGNVQRKQIMTDIFGTEASSGMSEVVSAMADGKMMELLTALQTGVEGENAKMASVMADNIGGDLKGLVSAWQEVGIAMTDANGGPIRELIQSITGAVRWIGEWVKENPKLAGTLGKIVGIIAVVATVFGTLAVTAATILGPLSLLRFAFGHLLLNGPMLIGMFKGIGAAVFAMGKLAMASPLGIAVAALAVGAILLGKHWDVIKAFFSGFFSGLVEGFKGMKYALVESFRPALSIFESLKVAFAPVVGLFASLFAPANDAADALDSAASAGAAFGRAIGIGATLAGVAVAIKYIGTAVLAVGKLMMANPILALVAALATAGYLLYQNWDGVIGGLKQLWTDFGEIITGPLGKMSDWWADKTAILAQDWEFLTGWLSAKWGALWDGITGTASGIWESITTAFSGGIAGVVALLMDWSPLSIFYRIFQPVLNWFGADLPDKFSEFGISLVQGLIKGIMQAPGALKDAIVSLGGTVVGTFKNVLGIRSPSRVFAALGGDAVDGLSVGIQANADGPLKRIGELGKKLTAAAGLSIPLLAGAAEPLQFDSRPPLQSMGNQGAAGGGNNYTIQITVNGTADTTSLAAEVRKQIEAFEREKAVRQRSRFGDLD